MRYHLWTVGVLVTFWAGVILTVTCPKVALVIGVLAFFALSYFGVYTTFRILTQRPE